MVGMALATGVLRREAQKLGMEPRVALDMVMFALPATLIGARLFHVLFEEPAYYAQHPLDALSPSAGWVFYGGLAGGALATYSYARNRGLDAWTLADIYSPAIAFGLVFGRLGCLGGGCCYGRPASWPFGWEVPWSVVYFEHGQLPEAMLAVPLHPTPLYEAAFCLTLFVVLSRISERRRFTGQIVLTLFASYGILRAGVELFRADVERGLWAGVSTSQVIGLVTAAFALWLWRRRACTPSCSTLGIPPSIPME